MKKFLSIAPIFAALMISSTAEAVYESSSDTNTEIIGGARLANNNDIAEAEEPTNGDEIIEIIDED